MTERQRKTQAGFAAIAVLTLAAVLLSMLAAVASVNYAVHEQNRHYAKTLQKQADQMPFAAHPPLAE